MHLPKWATLVGVLGVIVAVMIFAVVRGLLHIAPTGPPPHSTQNVTPEASSSRIDVPIFANLAQLEQMLDQQIPKALWQIDMPDATCAGPQHVKLFGKDLAITPAVKCHIVGSAVRGPIVLHGQGSEIVADVPILAHVEANNIAGMVSTHADGQAMAHAHIRIAIAPDWKPSGTVSLSYDWTTPPAVMLLGQRIEFTSKADERLKPIIAGLERKLPQALAGLDLRGQIDTLWRQGFTVVKLNDRDPQVWMRIVPQSLSYGGYSIVGDRMQIRLGLDALTQAVVGPRPADPVPSPLPDMTKAAASDGMVKMFVPVVADYAELAPVISRALERRSARPFNLPGVREVDARFSNIEVYGASDGRIAVGADIVAKTRYSLVPSITGRIWFAGQPHNAPGSQVVHFSNLSVSSAGRSTRASLLVAVASSPGFSGAIADALTQNFTHDFAGLQTKIERAIANRRLGKMEIDAKLQSVHNEQLSAYANGLYMPVTLGGRASVIFDPAGGDSSKSQPEQ